MKKAVIIFVQISVFLLTLLWVYAAVSKMSDYGRFQIQMKRQVLYPFLKQVLVFTLPPSEIIIALLLSFTKSRFTGLAISWVCLTAFTIYIALAVFHFLGKVPCSCGGILEHMGWVPHLFFNLFFLGLNTISIYIFLKRKESRDIRN